MIRAVLKRIVKERDELERTLRVVRLVQRGLMKSQIPRLSAALTYRTMFATIPVLVLVVVLLQAFQTEDQLRKRLHTLSQTVGISNIVVGEPTAMPGPDGMMVPVDPSDEPTPSVDPSDDSVDQTNNGLAEGPDDTDGAINEPAGGLDDESVGGDVGASDGGSAALAGADPADGSSDDTSAAAAAETELPTNESDDGGSAPAIAYGSAPGIQAGGTLPGQTRLDDLIIDWVIGARGTIQSLGLGAAAILFIAAWAMFSDLEGAFNHIYRAPQARDARRRVILIWFTLTAGGILLYAAFAASGRVTSWIGELGGPWNSTVFKSLVGLLTNLVLNTGLIVSGYLVLPNARVKLRPALIGGIVAGIMWEFLKYPFRLYVDTSAQRLLQLYGVVAFLPLFMLWVYFSWLSVLFGLQVSYALQHFGTWIAAMDRDETGPRVLDPAAILSVALAVARRFDSGKPVGLPEVEAATRLDANASNMLMEELISGGVVHRVAGRDGGEAYALARPAGAVTASSVIALADRTTETGSEKLAGPVIDELREARRQCLAGRTLEDLLSRHEDPPGEDAAGAASVGGDEALALGNPA